MLWFSWRPRLTLSRKRDHLGVTDGTDPEPALTVNSAVVGPHALALALLFLRVVPELGDKAHVAAVLLGDAHSVLASEEEAVRLALNVGGDSGIRE